MRARVVCLCAIFFLIVGSAMHSCSKKVPPERIALEAEVSKQVASGHSVQFGYANLDIVKKEIKVLSNQVLNDLLELWPNEKAEAVNTLSLDNFLSQNYPNYTPSIVNNGKTVLYTGYYEIYNAPTYTKIVPIIDILLLRPVALTDTLIFIKIRHETFRSDPMVAKSLISEFGATDKQASEVIQAINVKLNLDYRRKILKFPDIMPPEFP